MRQQPVEAGEAVDCPACGSTIAPPDIGLCETIDSVSKYTILDCSKCASSGAYPRVPAPADWYADIHEYYGWRWDFDEAIRDLRNRVPPPARVLEIGCGEGAVLQELGDYEAIGLDVNTAAIATAKKKTCGSTRTASNHLLPHILVRDLKPSCSFICSSIYLILSDF
jgi:SAM-dependent methyltransferase